VDTLCAQDRDLRDVVAQYGLPPLWARPAGFTALAKTILEQQVSFASAATLYKRLAKQVPGGFTPASIVRTGNDGLRALGVTRQKSAYIYELAQAVHTGRLNLAAHKTMSDADVYAELVQLKGIGPWTINVYLLMALRRIDVWPPGDLALHKAIAQVKGLAETPTSEAAEAIAQQWAPLRAIAARILWHGYIQRIARARAAAISAL
jgi:DNA-3-methyladenine glycosylase II